jgi:hypothetical protein
MSSRDRLHQGRGHLGFPQAVRDAFRFLQTFGFKEVGADDTIVRYATERVFLNIYHGRSSYELGIEIGPRSDQQKGYSL